jgi:hypothetical protein
MSEPIGAQQFEYAQSAGLSTPEIGRLWDQHCRSSKEKGYRPGGKAWKDYIDAVVRTRNEEGSVRLSERASILAAWREAEIKAKKVADEAYERDAVSLSEYLDSLVVKEPTTAFEDLLLQADDPRPTETVATFLARIAEPLAQIQWTIRSGHHENRCETCGCGAAVHSWTCSNHRYTSNRCRPCIDREIASHKKRQDELSGKRGDPDGR